MIIDLPPLREVIEGAGLRADKRFGQNFLMDLNITRKIVREAGLEPNGHVIEVGPGPGGLTRALLEAGHSVHAIEMDTRIELILKQLQLVNGVNLTYEMNDALKYDWANIQARTAIVSNLPYNVATPLIIGWLKQSYVHPDSIDRMALMVQSEVADRICAAPHSKTYGRLSVMCQWLMDVRVIVNLPPQAFTPPPKVHSSVVLFTPKHTRTEVDFKRLESIVADAFNQRRKMIRTSLKSYAFDWETLGINPELRAEDLTVADYLRLAST